MLDPPVTPPARARPLAPITAPDPGIAAAPAAVPEVPLRNEPRPAAIAARQRAVSEWRFEPIPRRTTALIELAFRAA